MNTFNELLDNMRAMHEKKNHDYAQESNRYSSFERAAMLASWFNDPVHKVFITMIGIKLARAAELLNGKKAKNESVDDTLLDLTVYSGLLASYVIDIKSKVSSAGPIPNAASTLDYGISYCVDGYNHQYEWSNRILTVVCLKCGMSKEFIDKKKSELSKRDISNT